MIWKVYQKLLEVYGNQNWWPAETPFEVCVGAILTQNTNWKNVEKSIQNLKKNRLLTPESLIKIPPQKLEALIKPSGFFRQKAQYLKKTGVLVKKSKSTANKRATSSSSRNVIKRAKVINMPVTRPEDKPQQFGGDRYDQPVKMSASDVKVAYSDNGNHASKIFNCEGNKPKDWQITLDMNQSAMRLKVPNRSTFNMPINYQEWESNRKVRMNLGGDKGRNMVDVNLEKTNSCRNDGSSKIFAYEVNATINKSFYFGCCTIAK